MILINSMSFLATFFDKKNATYAYHSGVWTLVFLSAWVIQLHRTTYNYDYVTQSLHASTTETKQHSYWTLDALTHAQVKTSAVGPNYKAESNIDQHACLRAEPCFKDGQIGPEAACIDASSTTKERFLCTVPDVLKNTEAQARCDELMTDHSEYHLMLDLCKQQFTDPATVLQVNDHTTFSISAAHSPRVLIFVVLTIMTSCNFYMLLTSLYRRKVRWFVNAVGTFSAAVAGKDEKISPSSQLAMFKRYLVAPLFVVLMLVWWFVFYNTTQHEVFWPKPFGTIFYSAISLVTVLYLGAGVDNDAEESTAAAEEAVPEAKVAAELTLNETPMLLSNKQDEFNVAGFTGSNKIKINAFLQPGKNKAGENYPDDVKQQWSSKLDFTEANYENVQPEFSYFNLMQTWVLPFMFLATYLVKHNYMLDSNITVIFVSMLLFGLLEIASKRMYETGKIFAGISSSDQNMAEAMMAPLTVIRLLLLGFQAILVWFVYNVADWNLQYETDGYWHVGHAKSQWDDVQYIFSLSFIIYFALLSVGKLYTLMPMYLFSNTSTYKDTVQLFSTQFDGYAVFLLNCFVAFVWLYETGAVGGILFDNENLSFDNPVFLSTLAHKAPLYQ